MGTLGGKMRKECLAMADAKKWVLGCYLYQGSRRRWHFSQVLHDRKVGEAQPSGENGECKGPEVGMSCPSCDLSAVTRT